MKRFNKEDKNNKKIVEELTGIIEEEIVEDICEESRGIVVGCDVLNVRAEPNSDSEIVATIKCGSEVVVSTKELGIKGMKWGVRNNDFYKIYNVMGIEGYCMKQFIELL